MSIVFPGDTCIHKLLSIYKEFDANPKLEVIEVFPDLLKAFIKVLHDSLMCKVKRLGIYRK